MVTGICGLSFSPIDSKLLFTRNDPQDPRLGDLAKLLPPLKNSDDFSATFEEIIETSESNLRHYALAGYPDDEGIRINGGRLGAALAPDSVRRPLYKMTPSALSATAPESRIWDVGNLDVSQFKIEDRHAFASLAALSTLKAGARWISIGGGHDYGYPDAAGFIEWCRQTSPGIRPLIVNFDAHLDVRPTDRGLSSGTPFYRMLEKYPDVDFLELGIQAHCNSRSHLNWVKEKGAKILMQEDAEASGTDYVTQVIRVMGDWLLKSRPVFLSVDIDAFSSAVAPGCSQSWATGIRPEQFFPVLELFKARFDIRVLGIYEVSPPLDHDDRTAKLAAQIIHRVIS